MQYLRLMADAVSLTFDLFAPEKRLLSMISDFREGINNLMKANFLDLTGPDWHMATEALLNINERMDELIQRE